MTEQQWLACEDPAAMLAWCQGDSYAGNPALWDAHHQLSDRKLRLFAHALMWAEGAGPESENEPDDPLGWLRSYLAPQGPNVAAVPAQACHFLRDIAGNPFRPVRQISWLEDRKGGDRVRVFVPWLTPTVLDLALAAYLERPGRQCVTCGGEGWFGCYGAANDREDCPDCRGTGRIEDGTLDPLRLAVLADALEEAGCDSEALLRHLRGEEPCPGCGGDRGFQANSTWVPCEWCDPDSPGRNGRDDGWWPLRGPHVRGCRALDLILGKE